MVPDRVARGGLTGGVRRWNRLLTIIPISAAAVRRMKSTFLYFGLGQGVIVVVLSLI